VWSLGTGPQVTPQVGMVTPDSPAERGGLRVGDVVVAVAGQPVFTSDELTQAIQQAVGKPFEVVVQRDGKPLTVSITANRVKEKNESGQDVENWRIGVILASKVVRSERYNPVTAAAYGAAKTWELTALTVKVLWKFVKLDLPLSNLGGPIQIATESHRQRQEGLAQLAAFTAFISVNPDARRRTSPVLRHRGHSGAARLSQEARGRAAARARSSAALDGLCDLQ